MRYTKKAGKSHFFFWHSSSYSLNKCNVLGDDKMSLHLQTVISLAKIFSVVSFANE